MPFDNERYLKLRKQGVKPTLAKELAKVNMPVDGGDVDQEEEEEE